MEFEISDIPEIKVEDWDRLVINDMVFYSNGEENKFLSVKMDNNYYKIELFDYIQEKVVQKESCYYPYVAEECIYNLLK